jgi:hypothetical protein
MKIRSYRPKPYASAEGFYESQYGKWSTTALNAGRLFPVGKHVQIEPYFEHKTTRARDQISE